MKGLFVVRETPQGGCHFGYIIENGVVLGHSNDLLQIGLVLANYIEEVFTCA